MPVNPALSSVAARHSTVFGINSRRNHWATRLRSAVLAPFLENVLEVGSCFIIRSLSLHILALPRSILEHAEELIKPKHFMPTGGLLSDIINLHLSLDLLFTGLSLLLHILDTSNHNGHE